MFKKLFLFGLCLASSSSSLFAMDNERELQTRTIHMQINKSIKNYSEETDVKKLILSCGHKNLDDEKYINTYPVMKTSGEIYYIRANHYSYDKHNSASFHTHTGWYTIDTNSEIEPDVIGDLTDEKTLTYVLPQDTWEIVYAENAPVVVLTENLLQHVSRGLKKNGHFIFPFVLDAEEGKKEKIGVFYDFLKNHINKEDSYSINEIRDVLSTIFKNAGFSCVDIYSDGCSENKHLDTLDSFFKQINFFQYVIAKK